ncbi:hypothetical protein ACR9E3_02460 [Actinomycetospora sp. C-140]
MSAYLMIAVLLAFVLISQAARLGSRRRSANAPVYEESLSRITQTNEKYCLILRPFGSDGLTRLPYGYRPWFVPRDAGLTRSLEEVVSRSAFYACGLQTYTLTDHRQRYAPVGPVLVRVENEHWQSCTETLLDRAHTVVIIIPPIEQLQNGFQWEIQQLSLKNLRCRTIIVLPPVALASWAHAWCVRQAAQILAALQEFAMAVDEVDPSIVFYWEEVLRESSALVVEIVPDVSAPDSRIRVLPWRLLGKPSPRRVGAKTYESALVPAIRGIDLRNGSLPERKNPILHRSERRADEARSQSGRRAGICNGSVRDPNPRPSSNRNPADTGVAGPVAEVRPPRRYDS